MNVVEFIRAKTEDLQQQNAEFIARFDSKFRNLSDRVSDKIANTLNNPWMSLFNPLEEKEGEEQQGLVLCSEAAIMYDKLQQQLGEETFLGQWYSVDQACIDQFADVTGDHQWIHTDLKRASKESPFRTTIAHGFLTLSLIPTLTDSSNPDSNPYPEAKMVVNYGLNQVRFPSPVRSGARVRARTRLIGLVPMKRSIEVVNEVSIEVEKRKRPACVAETVLRLYF